MVAPVASAWGCLVLMVRHSHCLSTALLLTCPLCSGAGKSTSLSMLTADLSPTYGTASLGGVDIFSNRTQCYARIGFCAQADALFDLLSGTHAKQLVPRWRVVTADNVVCIVCVVCCHYQAPSACVSMPPSREWQTLTLMSLCKSPWNAWTWYVCVVVVMA